MRDFAKLKILEVSAISWQYFGWSFTHLQRCESTMVQDVCIYVEYMQ